MISPMKICRQAQDIRLIHLAKQVGISEGWLSRIENGWVVAPLRLQRKISKALGVETSDLWPVTVLGAGSSESVLLGERKILTLEQILGKQPAPVDPLLEKIKVLGELGKKAYGTLHCNIVRKLAGRQVSRK